MTKELAMENTLGHLNLNTLTLDIGRMESVMVKEHNLILTALSLKESTFRTDARVRVNLQRKTEV